jgi:hypothetical protein
MRALAKPPGASNFKRYPMKLAMSVTTECIVVLIPKKEAGPLGTLLDACLDTAGNIEARDIGVTARQMDKAEDTMIALADFLIGK